MGNLGANHALSPSAHRGYDAGLPRSPRARPVHPPMAKSGKTNPPTTAAYRPAGATPLEVAQASPYAASIRLAGEPILHPDDMVGDRYKVDILLGRGGFGDVYRAVHQGTRERVALKVLRPELLADHTSVERFTHEARMSAGLRHPNTVRVFDFGRINQDGPLYLAMEYLEGESLETVLHKNGPLPPHRAAHIVGQVLKSLSEAHAKKLVHRDLKPENIFVGTMAGEADFVHVIDFGIAKFVAEGQSPVLTQAGAILGTPHYMSPEQIRGNGIDPRADLYSTGVVLYRCLTGKHPFDGETTFGVLAAHLQDDLPKVAMPGVDADLEALVAKSLARERDDRYATANAFRHALEAWAVKHPAIQIRAATLDDRTQMSEVLTPERLKATHEPMLPDSAATVIGAIPQASSAVSQQGDVVEVHAATLPDPSAGDRPMQMGSDTAVLAKPEALLAAIAQNAGQLPPKPGTRPPSRVGSLPPLRPPSKAGLQRAAGAVSGQAPAVSQPVSEEMRTVSMDLVQFAPAAAPDANVATTPGAPSPLLVAQGQPSTKAPPKPLPLWMLGGGVLIAVAVAGVVAWYQMGQGDAPAPLAPPTGAQAVAPPTAIAPPSPAAPVAVAVPVAPAPVAPAAALADAPTPAIALTVAPEPTPAVAQPVPEAAPPAPKAEVSVRSKGKDEPKLAKEPKAAAPKSVDAAPKAGKGGCAAAEGSKGWCTTCSAAAELSPSSKFFCPCLVARGKSDGLTYYCKCLFPKETHKMGSPPFCRCNPRDPSCQQE